ncbi:MULTISPECIES: hypothetical protein [unclassified Sulfurospirillum]|uniref:hypothetical protein n=1 Tax=unclassified Sulfurospirillum TaxID=2618290 RepID=UPI0025E354D5|nr:MULTISPECIES: hypothetical protein [unclassified Sulfurospirillum]
MDYTEFSFGALYTHVLMRIVYAKNIKKYLIVSVKICYDKIRLSKIVEGWANANS